jgi:hypothetical protein
LRLLTFLEFAVILAGAIGLLAGTHFDAPNGSLLGIYLIGAGLALAGAEALYTREMSLLFTGETAPRHSGFPAVVWGLMLLCVGGALIAYGYLTQANLWSRAAATLHRYPGWRLLAAGLFMVGFSILLYVDSGRARDWLRTLLFRLPRVVFAAALALGGVAVAAGGAWQMLDAKSFVAAREMAKLKIEKTLEGHPAQSWFRKMP